MIYNSYAYINFTISLLRGIHTYYTQYNCYAYYFYNLTG